MINNTHYAQELFNDYLEEYLEEMIESEAAECAFWDTIRYFELIS